MRIGRWILFALAALAALAVVAAITLVALVDTNTFKPQIASEIRKATGREVRLDGDLRVAWFPWFAVTLGPGTLANPPGFEGAPFAQWQRLHIGARLLPLLSNRLVMDRIRVEGLRVDLRRRADGVGNWQGLGSGAADQGDADAAPQIAGLDLRDARIVLRDASGTASVDLQLDELTTSAWQPGSAQALPTAVALRGAVDWGGAALRELRVDSTLRWTDRALAIATLSLDAQWRPNATIAGQRVRVDIKDAGFEFGSRQLRAAQLGARVGADVSATLTGLQWSSERWQAQFELKGGSLRRALLAAGITAPATTARDALGAFQLAGRASGAGEGAWRVEALRARLDSTEIAGTAQRSAGATAITEFALAGTRMALSDYLEPADAVSPPFVFPGAALLDWRARGTLTLQQATLDDTVLEGVTLRLLMDEGGLRADTAR